MAVWTPAVVGAMPTVNGTGVLSGRVTLDADEKVPSFPVQPNVNAMGALGPEVRVNVTVRSPRIPLTHPSRSKMPSPSLGVASK